MFICLFSFLAFTKQTTKILNKNKSQTNKERSLSLPLVELHPHTRNPFSLFGHIQNKILNKNKERSLSLPLVELHPHTCNPFSQFFKVSLPQLGLQGAHLSISNIYNNWWLRTIVCVAKDGRGRIFFTGRGTYCVLARVILLEVTRHRWNRLDSWLVQGGAGGVHPWLWLRLRFYPYFFTFGLFLIFSFAFSHYICNIVALVDCRQKHVIYKCIVSCLWQRSRTTGLMFSKIQIHFFYFHSVQSSTEERTAEERSIDGVDGLNLSEGQAKTWLGTFFFSSAWFI